MSEEEEETQKSLYKSLLPNKKAERERRKRVMPELIDEYLAENAPNDIDYYVKKYEIPASSIYYYFKQEDVSRKDITRERVKTLKEVRAKESEALSSEAEKIASIAIGLGGTIARRYLDFLDFEMARGRTIEFIAEDIMQWFEMKTSTLAEIDKLKVEIESLSKELSAAYAMNLPNFKYWLRSRILERYANQVLQARMMGVKLPVRSTINAMQTDLLRLEGDINDLFEGDVTIGIES